MLPASWEFQFHGLEDMEQLTRTVMVVSFLAVQKYGKNQYVVLFDESFFQINSLPPKGLGDVLFQIYIELNYCLVQKKERSMPLLLCPFTIFVCRIEKT